MHKSIGLRVLALSLLRLAWRLGHPVPRLPAGIARWQRIGAGLTHALVYMLMIGIPLSGRLYVSTQWRAGAPLRLIHAGDTATIQGRVVIDRADADLGMASDPDGEIVSRDIDVTVQARFRRR